MPRSRRSETVGVDRCAESAKRFALQWAHRGGPQAGYRHMAPRRPAASPSLGVFDARGVRRRNRRRKPDIGVLASPRRPVSRTKVKRPRQASTQSEELYRSWTLYLFHLDLVCHFSAPVVRTVSPYSRFRHALSMAFLARVPSVVAMAPNAASLLHPSFLAVELSFVELLLVRGRYPIAFTTSSVDGTPCARNLKLMRAAS
jgi:hypothetical protein